MTARPLQKRLTRSLRRRRRQMEDLTLAADSSLEENLFKRFGHLLFVGRFVSAWLIIFILLAAAVLGELAGLSAYYESPAPVPGGTYTEGILGDFTNANPIYATGPVDQSVSKLIFSSLLTYDDHNHLVGDLAQNWTVDPTGKIYTIHLRPGLKWQDGTPLTAADVVFTYHVIQNPDAQSPLNTSWQNVSVKAINPQTVQFTLADPLSSFPYSLTNGIIPQHILASVRMSEMRSTNFNTTDPIGSGPFRWSTIQVSGSTPSNRQEDIGLTPNPAYYGGKPKLSAFVVVAYHDQTMLVHDFQHGTLTSVVGLTSLPSQFASAKNIHIYSFPLTGANMVFFKTTNGVLADAGVRQALVKAADPNSIIHTLGYATIPVREPLLQGQLGYDAAYQQQTGQLAAAKQLLQQAGWVSGPHGIRAKAGQLLSFRLYAADTPENRSVTSQLVRQWRAVGADVQVELQDDSDLQNTVAFHTYDALLYGISIGVDPDVYAYWDSSQADPRSGTWLNLSEYNNSTADEALEAGRTRADPALRAIKYKPFLADWQQDAPALGLYQPRFLYISHDVVYGLDEHTINTPIDRFDNVQKWEIYTSKVTDQS